MKIGISGASGKLGATIIAELSARTGHHQLVAISRSPEKLGKGMENRKGDYDQPDTLRDAYAGLDRLVLIPSADLRPGVRGAQLKTAIDVAVGAGVQHIFLLSAAGTREASTPAIGETYWTGEQHLIRVAPRWTILRMNYYSQSMIDEIMMSLVQGVLAGIGEDCVAYVSRNDVAAATAGAVAGEGHAGAIYNLTGPEALTGRDVAAIASDTLGKAIVFSSITEEQLRSGLSHAGLPDVVADAIVDIKKTFVEGHFDVLTHDVERLSGRAPAFFRDVLTATKS
ncbi:NAD(P)H-binding protein [Rhizobium leguminosarum bv. viciae]|uniref:SDR family oxidoreductase n=1 Tax=Rhizobium leguminosarum TaxID=384 RepID=UPI001442493F|nr:SDR family oxidoreductase [Rhizobium leguminosarum]NKJ94735.1 NAD(P)H-binding protein [Rhizobium leguminosarum bv. viciae]NKK87451.1 NAD(P)H-binding protein [Rhizobium leguminosarum bv. viciae]